MKYRRVATWVGGGLSTSGGGGSRFVSSTFVRTLGYPKITAINLDKVDTKRRPIILTQIMALCISRYSLRESVIYEWRYNPPHKSKGRALFTDWKREE